MKMQRKYDAAFDLLQHCLRISPHASSALYEVAQYYVALKQPERGEAILEQAVRHAPDNYWYSQGLVNLYLQQQETDKAIALLEDMTARFPDKLDPVYSLLDLYNRQEKYDDVLALLNQLEAKLGKSEQMSMEKFRIYVQQQDKANAFKEIESLVAEYPKDTRYQVLLGDVYLDNGKKEEAYGVYRDVLDAEPDNAAALYSLANYYEQTGQTERYERQLDSLYLFENGTKTLCDLSQFWTGVDSFLWLIGEAIFHMLPVGICWSVTKKMGTTQMLGIVLGLTLVSGQLLNAYDVATTAAADIPAWDFGFFKVNMIGYQSQVIPAILAAFTLVYLEKFFRKITPAVISMIVVPFCSLVLSVIAAHFILGPIGWRIGSAISSLVFAGITGSFRVVFGAVFGFIYAPLVITGLHHMSNAIDLQLIADYGGTMLCPKRTYKKLWKTSRN